MSTDDDPKAGGDPDRDAILARRKRFVALALTGLTATAVASCDDGKGGEKPGSNDSGNERPRTCLRPMPKEAGDGTTSTGQDTADATGATTTTRDTTESTGDTTESTGDTTESTGDTTGGEDTTEDTGATPKDPPKPKPKPRPCLRKKPKPRACLMILDSGDDPLE